MLSSGLIDEVKLLLKDGIKENSKPMQSIGYKQVVDHIKGKISEKELLEKIIYIATRQYSKRQMTILKKSSYDIKIEDKEQIDQHIQKIKEKFSNYY